MGEGSVEVNLFAAARAAVGVSTLHANPGTLASILVSIEHDHADFGRVRPQCSFLLDGVTVHGDPEGIEVAAGRRIDVLPPFAGG